MRVKESITSYKNFWLIWINAAGSRKGTSLFRIQTDWEIKTNYLYHNESGLNKPLFLSMIKGEYISKDGKRLSANFGWIPEYVRRAYRPLDSLPPNFWMPNGLIVSGWGIIQKFMEENHEILFDPKAIRTLFRGNREILGRYGMNIFSIIFLFVLFNNLKLFASKYRAEIVLRMVSTLASLVSELDVVNYMQKLSSGLKGKNIPYIASNENELSRILCPLKW